MSQRAIVRAEALGVRLGERVVLRDVNFELSPGDFALFVGPNGGGKTTLFRALLGICEIYTGRALLNDASPEKGRAIAGYVPQRNDYDPQFPLRVRELTAMGALGPGMSRAFARDEERARVQSALETVGMGERANDPIRSLSGGQLQRVFIARALVSEPRLLFLDEPLSFLDARSVANFYELLRDLQSRGLTILMSTHDASDVRRPGDRLFEIDGGLREITRPEEVA